MIKSSDLPNFHGFTVKYLLPMDITSRPVRTAQIYYNDVLVFRYSVDKNTKEKNIEYNGDAMMKWLSVHLRNTNLAPDAITLAAYVLNFVRRRQFFNNIKKFGGKGFIDVLDEDGDLKTTVSIGKIDTENLERIVNIYGGVDYKLFDAEEKILY